MKIVFTYTITYEKISDAMTQISQFLQVKPGRHVQLYPFR